MQVIQLAPVPSQTFNIVLAGQYCKMNVYSKSTGVYIDLMLRGVTLMTGVICRDRVRLVHRDYLGFAGDLAFVDTQGTSDPVYTGFGSRYILSYLDATDVAALDA